MAKKKIAQILKYTAVFEPAEEGGYIATVPSLPGCISEGDTFEDAVKHIEEAASLYLEVLQDHKEDLPREEALIVAPIHVAV